MGATTRKLSVFHGGHGSIPERHSCNNGAKHAFNLLSEILVHTRTYTLFGGSTAHFFTFEGVYPCVPQDPAPIQPVLCLTK